MSDAFVLDACALIALLHMEEGGDAVYDLFLQAKDNKVALSMNKLNLLEVYYDVFRRDGEALALQIIQMVDDSPIRIISEISDDVFKEAGRLKASCKISLADSIALAEASASGGTLVTCDHHEFEAVEKSQPIKFLWLR